ncbi:geraniol 8-hydroxylase-like [Phragmites australis]|uniref:geraniol 8-hydroxylase-like n=1 Tax=Phragmites australis TaxID=29695 RepID=UPI002D795E40|nr:geraniol 8-hydroxylase-like [Phragmites australis]
MKLDMAVLVPWLAWLLVSFLAVYLLSLLSHRHRSLPPGPRPLPIIGSLHLLGNQPHRSLASLAKNYGPLVSLRLGTVTTVVVSSPEAAREFLQRHDAVFSNRSVPDATGNHSRNSVAWLPNDPRWRALRKLMGTELFAPHRLDALQHLRREKVQELVEHVRRLAREGAAVNIGQVAFITSLNLVSRTIFSRDLTSLDDHGGSKEFQELVTDIMEAAGSPNFFKCCSLHSVWSIEISSGCLSKSMTWSFSLGRCMQYESYDPTEDKPSFFSENILLWKQWVVEYHGTLMFLFNIYDITNFLVFLFEDLFSAGSDTSSSTVEWAMVELLQNPCSMAKACDELERVIGSRRNIEEFDINQLPYLQAVINETFRLHPAAPLLLPRHARVETKIMGYTIPKGSRVFVNVWAIGRDKETWSEPEKFVPERFLNRTVDLRGGDFHLIPFGAGRRICPGMPLAIRMVHVLLASLLNQFKWRLPADVERHGVDMTEKFGVTLTKAVPLCAIATPI